MTEKRKLRTNKQLLQAIEESQPVKAGEKHFCYAFDNGVFRIHITGGESGFDQAVDSVPAKMLPKLAHYNKVSIELWDHKDIAEEDLAIAKLMPDMDICGYKITFNVHVFPHKAIIVRYDERFKAQKWAKIFKGSKALVSLKDLCAILRFCEKLSHLKAFW